MARYIAYVNGTETFFDAETDADAKTRVLATPGLVSWDLHRARPQAEVDADVARRARRIPLTIRVK